MILRNPVNRFLKRIGAYTVSDEDLALSEVFESLPREEQEIIDRVVRKSQRVEEAGRQMGLTQSEASDLYVRALDHISKLVTDLPGEAPEP